MRPEVLEGDVREVLKTLDDESVQCVVTSPPYWGLRDYGTATWEGGDEDCEHLTGNQVVQTLHGENDTVCSGVRPGSDNDKCSKCGAIRIDSQLGLEKSPEEYVEKMVDVFKEVKRVLRKDGTVWLNLGDSYTSGKGRYSSSPQTIAGKSHDEPMDGRRPDLIHHPILKDKDLVGIPWRVAFALQNDGWYLRSDIIWNKPNPMPESVRDRPTKSHEYIFLLTKSPKYYYDYEAIKENTDVKGFRGGSKVTFRAGKEELRNDKEEFTKDKEWFGRNKRSVWKIDKYGDADTEAMYRQGMHRNRGKNLIATRPDLPTQKEFVDFMRGKTNAKELSEKSGIKLSTVEHWFRYDESGFSFPNIEDWMIITDFVKNEDMHKQMTNVKFHYDSVKSDGANKRSVWKITTKPYSGAHFATFPTELPETCIKAGTSKAGCCADCGSPYKRITNEKGIETRPDKTSKYGTPEEDIRGGSVNLRKRIIKTINTIDWKPTCDCNADNVPCVVLDIFAGSGTTLRVASKLGRKGIGIELNPEYIKILKKRCKIESASLDDF